MTLQGFDTPQTMNKIQRKYWWRLLIIGLLIIPGISSCDHDSNSSTEPDALYDLKAELAWDAAVNMDLWIIEPTGKGSGHGDAGITAWNTGNNDCGFGDACSPEVCSDLSCNTPERIFINRGEALPSDTEPFHHYEIGISNWSAVTTTMLLSIHTPTESRNIFLYGGWTASVLRCDSHISGGHHPFTENFCHRK